MKYFFEAWWAMLTQLIDDDWTSWLIIIIFWIVSVMVVGLIIGGVLWLIDSSFRPVKEGLGHIVGKSFTRAHTTTTLVSTGKNFVPITNYHPDRYTLQIEIAGGGVAGISVSKEFYISFNENDRVDIEYYQGRIFDSYYIKSVSRQ